MISAVDVEAPDCAELEIALERGANETYSAQFSLNRPRSESEDRISCGGLALDRVVLRQYELQPARYGQVLTDFLFGDKELFAAFALARAAAPRLRVRLSFGPGATELHDLRWETLRDPAGESRPGEDRPPLLHDHGILFSRYLSRFDWRPVRLRPRERLRALVVVASPSDLERFQLTPILADVELARAQNGLAEIAVTALVSNRNDATAPTVSLDRILDALREGHDILYLVCHGGFDREHRSTLFLEDESGKCAHVPGAQLVQRLNDLEQRPRLVVLASCESAGSGAEPVSVEGGALVALGPRLAEAGIPAVLSMQGRVRMRTVAEFMPTFFRELAVDGLIDRAVAVARGRISDPDEAWRPTLLMRLKRGRIWYEAGLSSVSGGTSRWAGLRRKVRAGRCTPIIGPGLLETLFEYRPWLARLWAKQHGFPLAPTQREDLTTVAQFLAAKEYSTFPHEQMIEDLTAGFQKWLPTPKRSPAGAASPPRLIEAMEALRAQRFSEADDPYRVLAALPLPVFVLACPDPLLARALARAEIGGRKKRPRVGMLCWRRDLQRLALPDPFAKEPGWEPTPEEPLVYHLFGSFDQPDSLVLTQDDYFDFLLNLQTKEIMAAIPGVVLERLIDSSLLFLGLQLEGWEFRAVFRAIMQQEGKASLSRHPHVAAQMEPEEGRVLDPPGTRAYFERYLGPSKIDLYWGTVDRFLGDLERQLPDPTP